MAIKSTDTALVLGAVVLAGGLVYLVWYAGNKAVDSAQQNLNAAWNAVKQAAQDGYNAVSDAAHVASGVYSDPSVDVATQQVLNNVPGSSQAANEVTGAEDGAQMGVTE